MSTFTETNLYCLVMAGGQGTRFWPESTSKKPKQYLTLLGDKSLLAQSLERFEGLVEVPKRFIVTVKAQDEMAKECSEDLVGRNALIFEPSGRNTAPCILLSIASLIAKGARPEDVVAIVPSDHVILNTEGFQAVMREAYEAAYRHKSIVTIGIPPNFPHTGYGYIEKADEAASGVFNVKCFKEKPDFETAKGYVASGKYLWNAGMFVAQLGVLLEEFEKNSPETFAFYQSLKNNIDDFTALTNVYNQIPKNSIDYAIMEKSERVMVIPARFDWNDLGSWDALETVIPQEGQNTLVQCEGQYMENAKGNIVYTPGLFATLINVEDLIVVANDKALLIVPKKDAQKVKNAVEFLKGKEAYKDLL